MSYTFLVVDDHPILRNGLKQIIQQAYPSATIHEAADAVDAMTLIASNEPGYSAVISDLSMPGPSGLDIIHFIRQHNTHTPILVLSIHSEDQYAIRCLKAGASGYLNKESAPDQLVIALERIIHGKKYVTEHIAEQLLNAIDNEGKGQLHDTLSDREFTIMQRLAQGRSVSEIGEELSISSSTVSTYRGRIMEKMHMKTNTELTKYCIEQHLID